MANVSMLEDVLGVIKMHPDMHNQSTWATEDPECGTTMCFAGWACYLDADTDFIWEERVDGRKFVEKVDVRQADGTVRETWLEDRASQLLDLNRDQASELFHASEDLNDVEQTVKDIANDKL